jgi:septum formation protein
MLPQREFFLASNSPRRRKLLEQLGIEFTVLEDPIEDLIDRAKPPAENVTTLSLKKAMSVTSQVKDGVIIAADTIVVLDGDILEKPKDASDAERMLGRLSGRVHEVYTGFTLLEMPSGRHRSYVERTAVKFRELGRSEIREYVQSGSPLDKAGAYGIQDDFGAVFVERVEGCFYNVVGLPLSKLFISLKQFLR